MSMYDMVMGDGSQAARGDVLLTWLGQPEVGRLRDAWVESGADGAPVIAIYTRNGGGNREEFQDVIDVLRDHPEFIRDADDDYDSTYATFYFRVPDEHREIAASVASDAVDTSALWRTAIDAVSRSVPR